ncbi:MAG: alpha/beta hydrolase [Actinomycetota bacterium]|nr:alpha/beta hydrolase [Actinomycetota bacterium]
MTGSIPPGTAPASWEFAAPWGARGYVTPLDGPVHWIEFSPGPPGTAPAARASEAPAPEGPPLVFVHGLGGSHLNWCLIGPQLAAGRRAVALDLRGFGLSPGTRGDSTVQANFRLLERFVREVTGTPVILVGNSMGGLISLLAAAETPDIVAGLVLIDPVLPLPKQAPDWLVASQFLLYSVPGLGELYLKLAQSRQTPQLAVRRMIDLCFADPSRADPAMVTASIALAAEREAIPHGDEALLTAARSLMWVVAHRRRYFATMAAAQIPVLLIGGTADRLVPVAAVRQAAARNPRWESVILAGVGHTPQLEVPGQLLGTLTDWLDRHFTLTAR